MMNWCFVTLLGLVWFLRLCHRPSCAAADSMGSNPLSDPYFFSLRSKSPALEINLLDWCIYVYDAQVTYIKENKLQHLIEPLAVMFPQVLRVHGKHSRLEDKLKIPLKVIRKNDLNTNADGGSCGIYTLKYIQYLASSRKDFSDIDDKVVQAVREQFANAVFTRD